MNDSQQYVGSQITASKNMNDSQQYLDSQITASKNTNNLQITLLPSNYMVTSIIDSVTSKPLLVDNIQLNKFNSILQDISGVSNIWLENLFN
jgi:hypothetical protein